VQPVARRNFEKLEELRKNTNTEKQLVYYIQTGVLATEKTDPHNITVKFKAPIDTSNDENAAKAINFEEFKVVDEYKLLKDREYDRYA